MGKKPLNQVVEVKISKHSSRSTTSSDQKKQQLINSLIEVVKPKVYIIDSSSFKTLVQQLTGNGTTTTTTTSSSSSSSSSPLLLSPPSSISSDHDHHHQHLPQIVEEVLPAVVEDDHDHHSPEAESSSMEYSNGSLGASVDESFLVDCNHLASSDHDQDHQMTNHHQAAYDPFPFIDAMTSLSSDQDLLMNINDNLQLQLMKEDSLVYGDDDHDLIQSLLLDADDAHEQILYPNYSNNYVCSQQIISQQEVSIYDYELSGLIY